MRSASFAAPCPGAFVIVAVMFCSTRSVRADRYEASLHAHAVGGAAIVSDPATTETAVTPLGGIAVRASYARSNLWQYDLQLTAATTGAAHFDAGAFSFNGEAPTTVPFSVTTRFVRFDAGATFRWGVELIPTARVAVGVAGRFRGAPAIEGFDLPDPDGRGDVLVMDLVGVGAVGLDYRFGPHWIAGASIGGSVAALSTGPAWRTVEASAHLAYYWYPLWFD